MLVFMEESKNCGYLSIYQLYKVIKFSPVFFSLGLGRYKLPETFISAEFLPYLHVNEKTISDVSEMNPFC